jgi:eukaryotic-like serine/threonine-protein kinase
MGTNEYANGAENERPQHEVYVAGFWISLTEVTNAEYARCMAAGACPAPQNADYSSPEVANRPVSYVGWEDAVAYGQWVGGRLPTEAEWEKACRGTKGGIYPWGKDTPAIELENYGYKVNRTTDVGSYPKGASPYGLLDMAGNVWEWTASRFEPYPYDASSGVNDPDPPGVRMLRGGGWFDTKGNTRCASRSPADASSTYGYIGFRVVASPLP